MGRKHTLETKQRLSLMRQGKNNPMWGKTGKLHPRFGMKHTEESKLKIKQNHVGQTGRKFSSEHKTKLSILNSGENNTMFGNIPWNTGLTKHNDKRLMKMSVQNSGELNPHYNKGKYNYLPRSLRPLEGFKNLMKGIRPLCKPEHTRYLLLKWGNSIKNRDNLICQNCGKKCNDAHHIFSKSKYPSLALNPNNGIGLCFDCHIEVHLLNDVNTDGVRLIEQRKSVLYRRQNHLEPMGVSFRSVM